MHEDEILTGSLMEETWMTVEQVAAVCTVETDWLSRHLEEGMFPGAECVCGTWRLTSAGLQRARRMRELERDFDAVPELAALVVDLIEEVHALRAQLAARASVRF